MGFLSRLFNRNEQRFAIQQGDHQSYLPPIFSLFAGGPSDAGVTVDQVTALTATTVLRCVNLIASTVATLPVAVVSQADSQKVPGHSLTTLLHRSPNEFMDACTFRECLLTNALLWGAGYAYIDRDETGRAIGLYPLRSSVTRPYRVDGVLVYHTLLGIQSAYLRPDQILVLNGGITLDGISPLAPVGNARNAIGLSLALEKFAGKFFSNGGNVGGILKLPAGMTDDAVSNFKSSWVRNYTGPENSLKTAVLMGDMSFTKIGTDPEAGQMLGSREHQIREICRVFGVPPHLAFDLTKASYASIEQQSLEFSQYCIQPHCVRFEQQANSKLLLTAEQDTVEVKFNLDAMLRTDIGTRYSSYNTGLQSGFLTVNEVRAREGLPPVAGGDVLRVPLNLGPADGVSKLPVLNEGANDNDAERAKRQVLQDTAARLLRKEVKAIQRAAKKYEGKSADFCAWAERFYRDHEALIVRSIAAPLVSLGAAVTAADYAKRHTDESLSTVLEAFDAGTIDEVLDGWETIRPSEIGEAVK